VNRVIQMLGALVLVVSPAAAASAGGTHCGAPPTEGVTAMVDISKGCFAPTVARVAPGDTVRFTNSDPFPHNLVGHAVTWGQAEPLASGEELEATFVEEGLYPFACTLHPGMVGVIVVEDGSAEVAAAIGDPSGATTPRTTAPGWMGTGLMWAGAVAIFLTIGWRLVRSRGWARRAGSAVG
jgi:plastocyanin